jgi:quinol monooxygenase YgiN
LPDVAASLIPPARDMIQAALDEEGCIAYNWSLDPLHPGRVQVFEEWTDEQSLAKHFAGAPYREMGAHLNAAGMVGFNVLKYRSDLAEPVYDEGGVARADFFTAEAAAS